jgi:hypothetical protein
MLSKINNIFTDDSAVPQGRRLYRCRDTGLLAGGAIDAA